MLGTLKVDELHALLVNAYPQGVVPRPNKAVGLEKVHSLSTVSAAIQRHLAARHTAAPEPQLPPPPPRLFEDVFRNSVGYVGSSLYFSHQIGSVGAAEPDVSVDPVISVQP